MIQITLEDHVAKALDERARALGLTLEAYLASLVSDTNGGGRSQLTADELARLIEAEAGPSNPRYSGTYSREDIYLGHD